MSSSPLPIRPRAATQQELLAAHARRHDGLGLAATPGGAHLYGTTPGGTRIVYSREQLLALASSPLSATPPRGLGASGIPSEISRSPGAGSSDAAAALSSSFGAAGTSLGRSPEKGSLRNAAALNRAMNIGAGAGSASGAIGSSPPASRSPLGGTPRSPGSAFNFSGPVSPSARRYPSAAGATAPSGISAQRPAQAAQTSPQSGQPSNSSSPPRQQAGGEQFAMDI